jgi:hypothetical protein
MGGMYLSRQVNSWRERRQMEGVAQIVGGRERADMSSSWAKEQRWRIVVQELRLERHELLPIPANAMPRPAHHGWVDYEEVPLDLPCTDGNVESFLVCKGWRPYRFCSGGGSTFLARCLMLAS